MATIFDFCNTRKCFLARIANRAATDHTGNVYYVSRTTEMAHLVSSS